MKFFDNIQRFISYLMIVLIFVFAFSLLFTSLLNDKVYGARRTMFVALLFLYGVYRIVRVYSDNQKKKNEVN